MNCQTSFQHWLFFQVSQPRGLTYWDAPLMKLPNIHKPYLSHDTGICFHNTTQYPLVWMCAIMNPPESSHIFSTTFEHRKPKHHLLIIFFVCKENIYSWHNPHCTHTHTFRHRYRRIWNRTSSAFKFRTNGSHDLTVAPVIDDIIEWTMHQPVKRSGFENAKIGQCITTYTQRVETADIHSMSHSLMNCSFKQPEDL